MPLNRWTSSCPARQSTVPTPCCSTAVDSVSSLCGSGALYKEQVFRCLVAAPGVAYRNFPVFFDRVSAVRPGPVLAVTTDGCCCRIWMAPRVPRLRSAWLLSRRTKVNQPLLQPCTAPTLATHVVQSSVQTFHPKTQSLAAACCWHIQTVTVPLCRGDRLP